MLYTGATIFIITTSHGKVHSTRKRRRFYRHIVEITFFKNVCINYDGLDWAMRFCCAGRQSASAFRDFLYPKMKPKNNLQSIHKWNAPQKGFQNTLKQSVAYVVVMVALRYVIRSINWYWISSQQSVNISSEQSLTK